jgi:phosphate transport system protein
MPRHFVQELDVLKTNIIKMGSSAEEGVREAIHALLERKPDVARGVLEREERLNALEVEIDQQVADLLALQQPVASDLRFILAALKINSDLERIGDHAVNIAESAIQYASGAPLPVHVDIPRMARIAQTMLRTAIDGFIHRDATLARPVLTDDDAIDDLNRKVLVDLVGQIRSHPESVEQSLELIRVSRNLERIADLATNIAEDVIYMAEAQVVKHNFERKS